MKRIIFGKLVTLAVAVCAAGCAVNGTGSERGTGENVESLELDGLAATDSELTKKRQRNAEQDNHTQDQPLKAEADCVNCGPLPDPWVSFGPLPDPWTSSSSSSGGAPSGSDDGTGTSSSGGSKTTPKR